MPLNKETKPTILSTTGMSYFKSNLTMIHDSLSRSKNRVHVHTEPWLIYSTRDPYTTISHATLYPYPSHYGCICNWLKKRMPIYTTHATKKKTVPPWNNYITKRTVTSQGSALISQRENWSSEWWISFCYNTTLNTHQIDPLAEETHWLDKLLVT